MPRRRSPQPGHHSGPEHMLQEIVSHSGCPPVLVPFYLAFARELLRSLRRTPGRARAFAQTFRHPMLAQLKPQASSFKLQARIPEAEMTLRTGNRKLRTLPMRPRCFPDFSQNTKDIVRKWFERGLSGKLLWRITRELLLHFFPPGPTVHR